MSGIKILAFDPRIGWALLVHEDNKNTVVDFGTFSKTFLPKKYKDDKKFIKYNVLWTEYITEEIATMLDNFKPDYVVSEDVFSEKFRINAFAVLTAWLDNLARVVYRKERKAIVTIAPRRVKALFTGDGSASKEKMKDTLLNSNIVILPDKDNLTEHAIDAIAVAVAFTIERDMLNKKITVL